jgi:hypothetical protein
MRTRGRLSRSSAVAWVAVAAGVFGAPRTAAAWYFPEHTELTRIALQHYASPVVAEVLQGAVDEIRGRLAFPICDGVGRPFAGTPLASDGISSAAPTATVCSARAICIPFAALPALAADHSVSVEDLWAFLQAESASRYAGDPCRGDLDRPDRPGLVAARVVGAAVETWREFKTDAPVEFGRAFEAFVPGSGGAQVIEPTISRRRLVRELDARLLIVDHEYSDRAAGSKAHFANALKSVGDTVDELKSVGNTDNALGQMLAHHLRSMVKAVEARDEPDPGLHAKLVATALLEHAFAVHFMQDAFAAGHIGTEHALSNPIDRLQRHDYLSARGLAVRRAITQRQCPPTKSDRGHEDDEDPYCWTAYGDGYLDVDNIPYVAEATARLQAQLALALQPTKFWTDRLALRTNPPTPRPAQTAAGARGTEKILTALARLLNPLPSWSFASESGGRTAPRRIPDEDLVVHALAAIDRLAKDKGVRSIGSITIGLSDGGQARAAELARALLGEPLRACYPAAPTPGDFESLEQAWQDLVAKQDPRLRGANVDYENAWEAFRKKWHAGDLPPFTGLFPGKALADSSGRFPMTLVDAIEGYAIVTRTPAQDAVACASPPETRYVRWEEVDVDLWRPLLVAWPTAQADIRTLDGRESFGTAPAFQVGYVANTTWVGAETRDHQAGLIGLGVTTGLAFRGDSILPSRSNGAFAEVNAGLLANLVINVPSHPALYSTIGFLEVRAPIVPLVTMGIGYAARSGKAVDVMRTRAGVGLYGGRVYFLVPGVTPHASGFQFLGWDLDLGYVALSKESIDRAASTAVNIPAELRFRLGSSQVVDQLSTAAGGSAPGFGKQLTLGVEVAGGFSWFL